MENFDAATNPEQVTNNLSHLGFFQGYFPTIGTDKTFIDGWDEIYVPSEPIDERSTTFTFYIPR